MPSLSGLTLRQLVDTTPEAIAPGTKNTRDGSAYGAISLSGSFGTPAWQLHVFVPDNDIKDAAGNVVQKGTRVEVEHYYNIDTLAGRSSTRPRRRRAATRSSRSTAFGSRAANRWRRQNGQRLLLVDFRWVCAQDAVEMDMKSFSTEELILQRAEPDMAKATTSSKGLTSTREWSSKTDCTAASNGPTPSRRRRPFTALSLGMRAGNGRQRRYKALREQWNILERERLQPPRTSRRFAALAQALSAGCARGLLRAAARGPLRPALRASARRRRRRGVYNQNRRHRMAAARTTPLSNPLPALVHRPRRRVQALT